MSRIVRRKMYASLSLSVAVYCASQALQQTNIPSESPAKYLMIRCLNM